MYNILNFYDVIFKKQVNLIGWGTGGYFRYFSSRQYLPLKYLVDNNPSMWGKEVAGFKVYNPEQLLIEDPENTMIVIYSSFSNDIIKQIKSMGNFESVNASIIAARDMIVRANDKLEIETKARKLIRNPNSNKGILVQGPVISGITRKILEYYAHLYPNDHIILSTWQDTPASFLEECENYVDHVILSNYPPYTGIQNRNYQIKSTIEGINKANNQGIQYLFKTRTDIVVLAPNILDQCIFLQTLYDNKVCQSRGMKNRILIPTSFTRKYLMFHPSDLTMFGTTHDLEIYWNVAYDNRTFGIAEEGKNRNMREFSLKMIPAESYFGQSFARKIYDNELGNTLQDSWNFYKDFFIVLDDEWFDLFWFKNPWIPDKNTLDRTRALISHYFWQQLYFNCSYIAQNYKEESEFINSFQFF